MNRTLTWANLFGVAVLAGLCLVQWQANRRLQLEARELRQKAADRSSELTAKKGTLAQQSDALLALREELARCRTNLDQALRQQQTLEAELQAAAGIRDELKASVTNWTAAVAQREDQLLQMGERQRQLVEARDEAIAKHNELAGKYRELVGRWNELQSNRVPRPGAP